MSGAPERPRDPRAFDPARWERVRALHAARPRSRLVRASGAAFLALFAWAWLSGTVRPEELFLARRRESLVRFLTLEVVPYPLRESGFTVRGLWDYAHTLWSGRGAEAMGRTYWISVLAIVLAGLGGALLAPLGARSLMACDPFPLARKEGSWRCGMAWRLAAGGARFVAVFLRAIPEYVWAFLLLAVLGPNAWPAVLALALHNAGILGRLGADTLENLDAAPLRALHGLGGARRQIFGVAAAPLGLPRYLAYFFYRYETCVREATVLGMLGLVSLGYWIQDARAALRYDEMLFYIGLGALLVLLGDGASVAVRAWLRRAR